MLVNVHQHAREPHGAPLGIQFDLAARLGPAVLAIGPQHPIPATVGAALGERLLDVTGDPSLIVGVDRLHHPRHWKPGAEELGVQAHRHGELFVGQETVGSDIPHPGADDGSSAQGEVHALGGQTRCLGGFAEG